MKRSRNLAYMTFVQGPLAGLFLTLPAFAAMRGSPGFGFRSAIIFAILLIIIGMLAGLISGAVVRAASSWLWPVTKTVEKPKSGELWDTELDGPA